MAGHASQDINSLYPFTIHNLSETALWSPNEYSGLVFNDQKIISNNLKGANFKRTAPTGYIPLGSFFNGDDDIGSISLTVNKGDMLLFTSGPGGKEQHFSVSSKGQTFSGILPVCINWCALNFSSDFLGDEFSVTLEDKGRSWGEWFAIGVPVRLPQ